MLQAGTIAMAKLCYGSVYHPQLLELNCRTMMMTQGLCGKQMQQQQVHCLSRIRIQPGSYGGILTSMMKPAAATLEIGGKGKQQRVVSRRKRSRLVVASSPSSCCLAGEAAATAARTEEDLGSGESFLLGFADDAETSGRRRAEELVVSDNNATVNENRWSFEVENLIQGHVGRYAFLAALLLGVGVGCLANVGGAEAAAISHMQQSHGSLDVDMRALALGPEGPLVEEFWDNLRRYGLYFITVVSGGVYSLVKPAVDAFKNPVTAVLVIVIITGSIYLVGLTVSAMLGINEFKYDYAV